MNPTYLQIFLLINVFLIGALAAIAIQHAYAHFKPHTPEPAKPRPQAASAHLPPAIRQQLLQASQANFQKVLDRSAAELQHDLQTTAVQLNKQLEKLGAEILNDEMKRYRADIESLRQYAEVAMGDAHSAVTEHQKALDATFAERQAELEAKLAEEMGAEKQRLINQIDTKLADAVASFLIETLPHNVDLGAQSSYLMSVLEEHKAEFKRRVSDEA